VRAHGRLAGVRRRARTVKAVLAVVRERPGVTASELAAASGVTGDPLYALLRRLATQGELAKRQLPGGQSGYALASDDAAITGEAGTGAGGQERSQARALEDPAASERETGPRAASLPDAGK